MEQLWGQFKSEARATYGLYSKDVDWEAIQLEKENGGAPSAPPGRCSRRC